MKKRRLLFLALVLLIGGISIFHYTSKIAKKENPDNIKFQQTRYETLQEKYQRREETYNIRDLHKNLFYVEDDVPALFMWRLVKENNRRGIDDLYWSPTRKERKSGFALGTTSGDFIYISHPEERYVSIKNHSGRNLEEVVKSAERHVFSVAAAPHPEYESCEECFYSPVSERYIVE